MTTRSQAKIQDNTRLQRNHELNQKLEQERTLANLDKAAKAERLHRPVSPFSDDIDSEDDFVPTKPSTKKIPEYQLFRFVQDTRNYEPNPSDLYWADALAYAVVRGDEENVAIITGKLPDQIVTYIFKNAKHWSELMRYDIAKHFGKNYEPMRHYNSQPGIPSILPIKPHPVLCNSLATIETELQEHPEPKVASPCHCQPNSAVVNPCACSRVPMQVFPTNHSFMPTIKPDVNAIKTFKGTEYPTFLLWIDEVLSFFKLWAVSGDVGMKILHLKMSPSNKHFVDEYLRYMKKQYGRLPHPDHFAEWMINELVTPQERQKMSTILPFISAIHLSPEEYIYFAELLMKIAETAPIDWAAKLINGLDPVTKKAINDYLLLQGMCSYPVLKQKISALWKNNTSLPSSNGKSTISDFIATATRRSDIAYNNLVAAPAAQPFYGNSNGSNNRKRGKGQSNQSNPPDNNYQNQQQPPLMNQPQQQPITQSSDQVPANTISPNYKGTKPIANYVPPPKVLNIQPLYASAPQSSPLPIQPVQPQQQFLQPAPVQQYLTLPQQQIAQPQQTQQPPQQFQQPQYPISNGTQLQHQQQPIHQPNPSKRYIACSRNHIPPLPSHSFELCPNRKTGINYDPNVPVGKFPPGFFTKDGKRNPNMDNHGNLIDPPPTETVNPSYNCTVCSAKGLHLSTNCPNGVYKSQQNRTTGNVQNNIYQPPQQVQQVSQSFEQPSLNPIQA